MRELLGLFYVVFLQVTSMMLVGIGGAFTSAGNLFYIQFTRVAARHDSKYVPDEPQKQSVIEAAPQAVNVDDGWAN